MSGGVACNEFAFFYCTVFYHVVFFRLKRLNLSGCRSVTSYGLAKLLVHQPCLEELDLSGVYKIDGETLTAFVEDCPRLVPQKLAYCNDIEDGPWPDLASGCQNLECPTRFCCQKLRN